ncbi:MAG: hypothetical protein R2792_11965 [Saprospiraceae bacterium]
MKKHLFKFPQLALQLDQGQVAYSGVRGLDSESYYFDEKNNRLGIAWFDRGTAPTLLDEGRAFTLVVRAKKSGMISSMIGMDEEGLAPEAGILVADRWEPRALSCARICMLPRMLRYSLPGHHPIRFQMHVLLTFGSIREWLVTYELLICAVV